MLRNLRPNRLNNAIIFLQFLSVRGYSVHPGYDNARYYAIQITASQFLDKPRDASANVARSCDCQFADLSRYISETKRASTKVNIVSESE